MNARARYGYGHGGNEWLTSCGNSSTCKTVTLLKSTRSRLVVEREESSSFYEVSEHGVPCFFMKDWEASTLLAVRQIERLSTL